MIQSRQVEPGEILADALKSGDRKHRANVVALNHMYGDLQTEKDIIKNKFESLSRQNKRNYNDPRFLLNRLIDAIKVVGSDGTFNNQFNVVDMQDDLMQLIFTYLGRLDGVVGTVDTDLARDAYHDLSECLAEVERDNIKSLGEFE